MIAGETEMMLADHVGEEAYDEFLFFGNKEKRAKRRAARKARRAKRRSNPRRISRRAKRRNFFSQLGQAYRDLGGGAAIGGAIDTIVSKPSPIQISEMSKEENQGLPSDFKVGLGSEASRGTPKKDNSMVVYALVGGVVAVGIGVLVYQSQKNKNVSINQG
ncbi:hypothetical protein HN014_04195 [Aquimarina sp. TRL1]|uniref:hypothetical protein n=1 Tax=Aquimarina sp. (strain TRL1) TaxID=2736252 RepID=UPI00158869BC|nr:hypothetical protein [Aquimarina sp. TRL1]QKX04139.1 hypothetical protein HN014_04195 [Aquimarina sp. TRL1]